MTTPPFRSTRDVIVRTEAFADAVQFYSSVLGLPVGHRQPDLVGFETGSFCLYVERGTAHGPVLELLVPDVAVARAHLVAAGCQVLEEDARVPRCYLRDPYGLTFNIAKARAAQRRAIVRMARALTAVIALPGMVAFAIPLGVIGSGQRPIRHLVAGVLLLVLGTALLLWCVREFYVVGRGTLAAWDPPQHLVTTGPYRWSRNPMYLAVITILAGWCTLSASRTLLIYSVAVLCGFWLRVVLVEEPWAARRFADDWQAYRARVPRWLIQL